jgi:transcriptional regulator with XRE-family HTH domain
MPRTNVPLVDDKHPHAAIGERLELVRLARELQAKDVCRQINVRPNTYSQWASGASRPRLDDAIRFCEHFGATLDWLFRGDISGLPHNLAQQILRLQERGRGSRDRPPESAAA